ncbi:MAG: selenium cofactor biosynthesis protein YqeC [Bacillota bacterium]
MTFNKDFIEVLGIRPGQMVTMVGAGGKTSLLQLLCKELVEEGFSVIMTTTTKIYPPSDRGSLVLTGSCLDLGLIKDKLAQRGAVCVGSEINHEHKLVGLTASQADACLELADFVLVEGDGAAGKSFKAPGLHEPVIPERSTIVCAVAGLSIIGRKLKSDIVHRPEFVAKITGLTWGDVIGAKAIAKVLARPEGYYTSKYSYLPVLNQADNERLLDCGVEVAQEIFALNPLIQQVVLTSAKCSPAIRKVLNR